MNVRSPLVPRLLIFALSCPGLLAQTVTLEEPNRGGEMDLEAQDPAVARDRLHTAEGYEIELFATEKDFPIGNPVTMAFDGRGRLWVATMPSYPQRLPDAEPDDKIIILEDTDGDGRADTHTVFADGLHVPTGFELGDGGVYVAQQPNLMFLKDTDGDDVADRREVVLHGFGTEDSHHSISAFTWGPGGGLYFQEGTFHHSQVETPWGPVRLINAGVFRYKPKRHWLEVFVSYPFANPWGHIFDAWGQNFIADASGGANYFGSAITGSAPYPRKRSRMKVFTSVVRPTAGCEIVSSRHFPPDAQGNFLVNNTIGFQGIKQHRMIEEGSGFTSEEVDPLVYSTDINFRPVDLQFGPDGALYVVDWFNPLVGHMQYSLRDPRRDHGHGRIWRITYPSRPLLEAPDLEAATTAELVGLLQEPEDRLRYRVRRELRVRPSAEVSANVERWLADVGDRQEENATGVGSVEHAELEALWVHQSLNLVDEDLLGRVLGSPEPRARAAATRVVRFWRDRIADPGLLLAERARDEHPRAQLEAVLGLSYLPSLDAVTTALEAVRPGDDYYLDYVLGETVDTLEPEWMPSLMSGRLVPSLSEPAATFLLSRVETDVLADVPSHPLAERALLDRPGATPEMQRAALVGLEASGSDAARELVAGLERADRRGDVDVRLLASLGERLRELGSARVGDLSDRLTSLARSGAEPEAREAAFGALIEIGAAAPLLEDPLLVSPWLSALGGASSSRRQEAYDRVDGLVGTLGGAAVRALGAMPQGSTGTFGRLVPLLDVPELSEAVLEALRILTDPARVRSGETDFNWSRVSEAARLGLAGDLAGYLDGIGPSETFSAPTRRIVALGNDLADQLPAADRQELQRSLDARGIQFVELRPIPHQMVFDRQEIVVEAGRPVEISFVNVDVMPHNVVVSKPGTLEDLGRMADAMARDDPRRAEERGYIPARTDLVLVASSMVPPGRQESLTFVAPETPGNYPYSCTFPGHWILMNGNLRVVEPGTVDLRTTQQSAPASAAPVVTRHFVEDWSFEQLEPAVRSLGPETPSVAALERGRTLFDEIGCQRCHRKAGEGGEVGPELDGLADRFDVLELLRHVLDPSALVAEEYETVIVKTRDGDVHTGLLAGDNAEEVRLYGNPLVPEEVTVVARGDIEVLSMSPLSPMPSGLLTTLEREEVLDLLRFLRFD